MKITKKIVALMLSLLMLCGCIPSFTNEASAGEPDTKSFQDVLATADGGFPEVQSNAWVTDNGQLVFINDTNLRFKKDGDEKDLALTSNLTENIDGNYVYLSGSLDTFTHIMITCYMTNDKVTSISLDAGASSGWTDYIGTYHPQAPKSSSPKKYSMKASEATNGTVELSKSKATKGSTVTINVKPNKGFTLETLTVNDAKGNELEVNNEGKNEYSFTAPKGNVAVEATFMEDNSMLNFCSDVKAKDECYDAVKWAYENNITTGVNSVTFGKEITVTRAQVATLLYRAAGAPEVTNETAKQEFNDVKEGDYFEDAVKWAANNNITQGTGDNNFEPNKACTNGEIVVMLSRAENILNKVNPRLLDPALEQVVNTSIEEYNKQMENYFNNYANQMAMYEKLMNETANVNNECTRETAVELLYIQCGSEE